jgi:excisionase family DNA binding protein
MEFNSSKYSMSVYALSLYLNVSKTTIYRWLKAKKVPAKKVVGVWRFNQDEVAAWINSGRSASGEGQK